MSRARVASRANSATSAFPGVTGASGAPNTLRGSPATQRSAPATQRGAPVAEDARFPPSDPRGARLPALSAAERAYMERKAKEASLALIDHAHTLDGPVQWHYTGKFRGIQMYRGEGSFENAGTAGTEFLCGVTTMLGSIEEVSWFFDQPTTDKMRAKQPDDVLDAGVLYSLVHSQPDNPFYRVAVKYQSYEGPSRFSRARDYCFLECQNTFKHASGRRGWVLSMHSIKLPSCPEIDGIVRGSMYHSGYVFVEAEREGYMDVMHSLQINFKSNSRLPHFLLNAALKRRILSVVKISREIQMARLGRQGLLKKKELMPKKSRSQCLNCSRKFTIFVRKTRCRMCGEVVCQACAPVMEVDVPGRPLTKTRVCSRCYSSSPTSDEGSDDFIAAARLQATPTYSQIRRDENETHYSMIRRDENGTHYSFSKRDEKANNYTDGMEPKPKTEKRDGSLSDDDDELEEDGEEEGLLEQSMYSVFAQSRFTRTSADSMVLPEAPDVEADDISESDIERYSEVSSAFWKESSVTSSAWKKQSVMEPLDETKKFEPEASSASSIFGASHFLTPEDTDEELDKRARRYNPTLSIRDLSREYGRGARPVRPSTTSTSRSSLPPPPPPYSPTSEDAEDSEDNFRELDASALREHNTKQPHKNDGPLMSERKMFANELDTTVENDMNSINKSDRLTAGGKRGTTGKLENKFFDPTLRDTTSSAILNQVRANRSRTIQFSPEGDYRSDEAMKQITAEHAKRMADIKRLQELADEAERASKREVSTASIPTSRSSSNKTVRREKSNGSIASSRSSSNKLGSPEQRPGSTTSSRTSSNKLSSPNERPGSVASSRSSSQQQTVHVKATLSTQDSQQEPRVPDPSPPFSPSGSDQGGDKKEEAEVENVPSNPKLISIRRTTSTQSRSTDTFSQDSVRVSGPPVDHMDDLEFSAIGGASPEIRSAPREDPLASPAMGPVTCPPLQLDALARESESTIMEDLSSPRRSTVVLLERISSPRESTMFDEDLINRPTEDLMEQVRSNRKVTASTLPEEEFRSTEAMLSLEEEHRRRMEELNRIAMDATGARISHFLDSDINEDEYDELAMSRTRVKRSGTFVFGEDEMEERSTEVMEDMAAEHQRRMDELNRIAIENVGTRISKFGVEDDDDDEEDEDEVDVDSMALSPAGGSPKVEVRISNDFDQSHLEFVPTIEEESTYAAFKKNIGSSSSTEQSERPSTPRESNMSDMSLLDEELVNRPTEDLMEQVRANRSRKLVSVADMSRGLHSTMTMRDVEAQHKKRMEELNRIALDHVGQRISKFDMADERASEESMAWRNTDMMEQFESEHEREMYALQEKLRQLEFECRESIASVLTVEEMELEDEAFDEEASSKSNDASWIGATKPSKLLRTTRAKAPQFAEPVSARTLYEQIAELSKLQQEMALAQTDGDEDEFRARIKEQYRVLRSLKLRGW